MGQLMNAKEQHQQEAQQIAMQLYELRDQEQKLESRMAELKAILATLEFVEKEQHNEEEQSKDI